MPRLDREAEDAAVETAFMQGDDQALRAAYDAHGSLVYSFCRRTLPEDRAKDVTQEVFVSAWKARSTFDPTRGRLAGWLLGIARNRIIDHVRSERRHIDHRAPAEPADLPVESELEQMGDRMLVADALQSLPDRPRIAIELSYFTGLTHSQIADQTSVPLGTVKSDIRRGLTTIRRHLESAHDR